MKVFIILISIFACGTNGASPQNKSVDAVPVILGEIPWIVSLRMFTSHNCAGSILDKNHVLTSAFCVYGSSGRPHNYEIQYGVLDRRSSENIIQVKNVKIHEGYMFGGNYPNDIAIVTLQDDIILGENVKAITLPSSDPVVEGDSIDSQIAGWGDNADEGAQPFLLRAEIPLYNDQICEKLTVNNYDPNYHICAGDLDGSNEQCSGDPGGPLFIDGVQHGIYSWIYRPCTVKNRPSVYTRVASHLQWIAKNIAN